MNETRKKRKTLFTCEICRRQDRQHGKSMMVGTTYGPGPGRKILCPQCTDMFNGAVHFCMCEESELDRDRRGAILDFLLGIKERLEEVGCV